MMSIDWTKALQMARPGAVWSIGATLESLQWQGPGEAPTQAELESAWSDYVQAQAAEQAGSEAMTSARSAMAAILDSQTLADRMILQTLRVDIEHALNLGQVDLALYTIVNAEIPAELEPVRAQILALFPQS